MPFLAYYENNFVWLPQIQVGNREKALGSKDQARPGFHFPKKGTCGCLNNIYNASTKGLPFETDETVYMVGNSNSHALVGYGWLVL